MTCQSTEPLLSVSERLGLQGQMVFSPQTQLIRSIQRNRNEELCFATDKQYCCGKDCEWRDDCRAMLAVWMG